MPAVLDGDDATIAEATTVPTPVDVVDDGRLSVPGAQEVGMQGMRRAPFYRVTGSHQRLPQHKYVWFKTVGNSS